jgi:hypothetical protein
MLQRRFGHFDGRLLGTWIHFRDRADFELFEAGRLGASPSSPLVQQALARSPGHTVALLTTLDHERRHFHDYLLSPLGAASFRCRFMAQYLSKEVLLALHLAGAFDDATFLPLPLSRWIRLGHGRQEEFVERLNAYLVPSQALRPPRLEGVLGEIVPRAILTAANYYTRLRRLWITPELEYKLPITPSHVWEASALLVQYAAARKYFGAEGLSDLLQYIYQQPQNRYVMAILLLRNALGSAEEKVDPAFLSKMVTWALLGDERDPLELASPVVRFLQVADLVSSQDVPPLAASTAELFGAWDEALQCPSIEESLQHSLRIDEEWTDWLTKKSGPEGHRFQVYAATRRRCVEGFLADPDAYVSPHRYTSGFAGILPLPPLLVEATEGWWDEAAPMYYATYHAAGGAAVASPLQVWNDEVDIRFAEELMIDCAAADLLMDEYRDSSDPLEETALRVVVGQHLRHINVLRHLEPAESVGGTHPESPHK